MVKKPSNIGSETPENDDLKRIEWKRRRLSEALDDMELQPPPEVILERMRKLLAKKVNPKQDDTKKPA